jgi:hypothetical protein
MTEVNGYEIKEILNKRPHTEENLAFSPKIFKTLKK